MTACEQRKRNEIWVQRLRDKLRLKHYAYSTEKSYCTHVRNYLAYVWKLPGEWPSEKKVEDWLSSMSKRVSGSTQNGAFNAVLFFYEHVAGQKLEGVDALRAKCRQSLKYCPGKDEILRLIPAVDEMRAGSPTRLMVKLMYGSGLRLGEVLKLRVKDIRFELGLLEIHDPKQNHDRTVPLPACLANELKLQLKRARLVFERDRMDGIPISMPEGLARKYASYPFTWNWAYVFPQLNRARNPRTGQLSRHHCFPATVQRAVKEAAESVGLYGKVTPHTLRHAFATHCLQDGGNIRDIQDVLGHKSVETTMTYTHAATDRIKSPLERMAV